MSGNDSDDAGEGIPAEGFSLSHAAILGGISDAEAERLLFSIRYRGPWERLEGFFLGIRRDGTLRWELRGDEHGIKGRLNRAGDYCNRRDISWRNRHLTCGTRPLSVWRRHGPRPDQPVAGE